MYALAAQVKVMLAILAAQDNVVVYSFKRLCHQFVWEIDPIPGFINLGSRLFQDVPAFGVKHLHTGMFQDVQGGTMDSIYVLIGERLILTTGKTRGKAAGGMSSTAAGSTLVLHI
jgi:hypothetical protein